MVWHLKRKHKLIVETIPKSNDPERFKCSYCGKIFTQGRGLKDHINTHTGMYYVLEEMYYLLPKSFFFCFLLIVFVKQ